MKMILSIFLTAFASELFAANTNASASKVKPELIKIGTIAATNYYDQTVIVTGKVVQVTIRPTVTFLNLDKSFPNSPFAVVIFHGKSQFYGNANALKGKSIEIKGKIKNFKDKPEIVLDNTNQLTVVGMTNLDFLIPKPAMSVLTNTSPATQSTNLSEIM